jgi:glyoxylase-like metal-dependent hydrolase (beta-lactamase superfamily II)
LTAVAPRVDVRTSGIWQLNSVVLSSDGDALVVDPGYFPRELLDLQALARERGTVRAVVFTHGHWDHVLGWRSFPQAPVHASPRLVRDVREGAPTAARNLANAADFDGRWYVPRPGPPAWPDELRALDEGARLRVGAAEVEALLLPGHSADGLALRAAAAGLLITGDHLSPCEIPFVDDLDAYRRTLRRLLALLDGLDEVIPGHGPRLSRVEARAVAAADLEYLDALADCRGRGDAAGALALALPRAAGAPGMSDAHRDNCRAAGLAV